MTCALNKTSRNAYCCSVLFITRSQCNLWHRYRIKRQFTDNVIYALLYSFKKKKSPSQTPSRKKKGFVILTKSFVKIGITKYFATTKWLVLSKKRLVAAAKFLVAATKILFVVPNFVAVTKPFFSVLKLRNLMWKIFQISLTLNFTPNTLGCYGLGHL